MDKIIGYEEDLVTCKNHFPDAMDAIMERVEPVLNTNSNVLHVETPVAVPSIKTKLCCVRLKN